MNDKRGSLLETISPVAILAVHFILIIPVFISFDYYTPPVFFGLAVINVFVLGRVKIGAFLKIVLPLATLPVGLFFLNLFFSRTNQEEEIVRFLFAAVSRNSLRRASIIFIRTFTMIIISVSYLLLTEPQKLVNALMQQLNLSPRVGFALYVAWNIIPQFREDLRRIENAHKVRLKARRKKLAEIPATAITLLSGAIRHAERASVSMAARGIETGRSRTYLKECPWRRRDTIYLIMWMIVTAVSFALITHLGLFTFGLS